MDITLKEAVEQYEILVRRIAYNFKTKLPPSILIEDLIQSGMIGLIEAYKRYDPSQGASFETYAGIRIRGAIMDELRRGDWTPRSVHRQARRLGESIRNLEKELGRRVTLDEISKKTKISKKEINKILREARECSLIPETSENGSIRFDLIQDAYDDTYAPEKIINYAEAYEFLHSFIESLCERDRVVFSLRIIDDLTDKDIGDLIGVSESRISQILKEIQENFDIEVFLRNQVLTV